MGIGEDKMEAISGMEKAWQVSAGLLKAGFVIMLFWGAWQDLRRRKIGVFLLTASGIGAAGLRIIQLCISSRVLWNQVEYGDLWKILGINIGNLAAGAAVGAVVLFLSKITEGAIGEGDGWFFVVSGLYLGAAANLLLLAGGFMLCFLYSGIIMVWSVIQGEDIRGRKIPFIPFLVPVGFGILLF